MPTKKAKTPKNTSKRRRCSRGFHFDKTTQMCKEFRKIQVFKDLKDEKISETKNTIALESLGDAGAVLKVYKKGDLVNQTLVPQKKIEEAREQGVKQTKVILRNIKKAKNHPSIMKQDKKFQRFLRMFSQGSARGKMMGGDSNGDSKSDSSTDILIQKDVYDQLSTDKMDKLKNKITELEAELNKERGIILASFSGSMGLISLLSMMGPSEVAIEGVSNTLTELHNNMYNIVQDQQQIQSYNAIINSDSYNPNNNYLSSIVNEDKTQIHTLTHAMSINDVYTLSEPIGFLVSFIMDLLLGLFPSEPVFWLDMTIKYSLYTVLITSGILTGTGWLWGFPFGYVSSAIGFLFTTTKVVSYVTHEPSEKEVKIEKELQKARENLAKEVEKQALQ